jgi:methionyl-tRNA formyltransferase
MRIVFMGTPPIAVASLAALQQDGHPILAVVTAPDRPAGRGRQLSTSAVKQYALERGLKILQPEKLKSPVFLDELRSLGPELIVVVAFRILPEEVWGMPPLGTINLHASLLPQYRGAAPINRVIMNGETETGVTTFFIEKDIDTGKIIMQEPVPVMPDDNAGTLHDRIMEKGADLLVKTVRSIQRGNPPSVSQAGLVKPGVKLKSAPKIHKEDCRINWRLPVKRIYDHIRGLSPVPTAWTELVSPEGEQRIMKIFAAERPDPGTPPDGRTDFPYSPASDGPSPPGTLLSDGRSRLGVACGDGIIDLREVQLEGKKKLAVPDFLRGIQDITTYRFA